MKPHLRGFILGERIGRSGKTLDFRPSDYVGRVRTFSPDTGDESAALPQNL